MTQFKLQSSIPQLTAEMRRRAAQTVTRTAFAVQGHAKASMSGPKSGRVYRRGAKFHRASAPGEAPAIDYGVLVNSIEVSQESDLRAAVGTNVEYGLHLEFGTVNMGPRPWLGPAFEKAKEIFETGMREIVNG
jgi:phage gpG-like protein